MFCSRYKVNDLYMCTHNDPDGIASYVQVARFGQIIRWRDPGLLGRVLENFNSLKILYVSSTVLPDEMLEQTSHEGFGKTITTFHLLFSWYSLSMLMSLITAFTSLQDLLVRTHASKAIESPSVCSVLPRREPLDSLEVVPCKDEVAETLANLQLTSRRLKLELKPRTSKGFLHSLRWLVRS